MKVRAIRGRCRLEKNLQTGKFLVKESPMLNQEKLGARAGVFAGALVVLALLACKKSGSEATPTAAPVPETPPAATPEAPKAEEPAPSASPDPTAETPKPVATTTAKVTLDAGVQLKDAGTVKDASVADAAADAAKPASNSAADAKAVEACCAALAAESKKTGPHTNKYKSAAAVCSGIAASVKKGAADATSARTTIRAQLTGVPIPGGC